LFRINGADNFAEKESMVKDESIRERMFASIASWLSTELSPADY
jgi:hypothetical protein